MNKYILSYLKEYYNSPRMDRVIDYFKVDFDNYLYAYGYQFGKYDNLEVNIEHLYKEKGKEKVGIKKRIKKSWNSLYAYTRHQAYLMMSRRVSKTTSTDNSESLNKVLFIDHVSIKIREEFAKKNIRVYCIEEFNNKKHSDIHDIFEWYDSLSNLTFRERLEQERYDCLDRFIDIIRNNFNDFDGLFVGNDEYFMPKLFIDAFKSMNIPTYNWSHGLDATVGMHKRTDYTLVWGPALKDNQVKDGKEKDSIIVSGNIHYYNIADNHNFRNTIEDVLVLTSATIAHIRHSWDYEHFEKWDRSLLITYIYSIENVLKGLGVDHARLRLHPINNKMWVDKFIDTDFYSIDYQTLDKSLEQATLAIGPTSSTFVEALHKGVTYLIYEPGNDGKNITDEPLVSPFDGSDPNIKVAFTEEQLKEMIDSKYSYNKNVLEKYMIPFDIDSFIHTLGKKLQTK